MNIAYIHQNEVIGVQGGVERYIATLMDAGSQRSFLITESVSGQPARRLSLPLATGRFLPKWIRYAWAVLANLGAVRRYIQENDIKVLEFSRAEYALFAFLLPGRKVFTFHGTGPIKTEIFQKMATWTFSWLVLFQADIVHIIGPDARALPGVARRVLASKIRYSDAWFDDCFHPSPLPDPSGVVKIFYAGRIAPQKNPKLLFAVMRAAKKRWGEKIVFEYFGSDGALIPEDLVGDVLINRGLQSPEELARSISACHFGLLTSFYEGSPFIVIEALACGRGYVLPPVRGLIKTYENRAGIVFSPDYEVGSFLSKIEEMTAALKGAPLRAEEIARGVQSMSKKKVTESIYQNIYDISL